MSIKVSSFSELIDDDMMDEVQGSLLADLKRKQAVCVRIFFWDELRKHRNVNGMILGKDSELALLPKLMEVYKGSRTLAMSFQEHKGKKSKLTKGEWHGRA